jgi:hypothetical protein
MRSYVEFAQERMLLDFQSAIRSWIDHGTPSKYVEAIDLFADGNLRSILRLSDLYVMRYLASGKHVVDANDAWRACVYLAGVFLIDEGPHPIDVANLFQNWSAKKNNRVIMAVLAAIEYNLYVATPAPVVEDAVEDVVMTDSCVFDTEPPVIDLAVVVEDAVAEPWVESPAPSSSTLVVAAAESMYATMQECVTATRIRLADPRSRCTETPRLRDINLKKFLSKAPESMRSVLDDMRTIATERELMSILVQLLNRIRWLTTQCQVTRSHIRLLLLIGMLRVARISRKTGPIRDARSYVGVCSGLTVQNIEALDKSFQSLTACFRPF